MSSFQGCFYARAVFGDSAVWVLDVGKHRECIGFVILSAIAYSELMYGLFTILYIHSLLSATSVAINLHFAYAGFDLRLFDHVGGLRILKVKRGWFHTDRPDQRPFISFQLDSYDCMPLNPHLTWIRAVDGEYIGLRRSLHRFVLPKYALFPSLQKSLSTLHSFIWISLS